MQKNTRQYLKVSVNIIWAIIVLLIFIFLVPKLLVYFMPFVVGWIIAAIANPIVQFFEKKLKVKRKFGSVLVMVIVLGGVIVGVYFGVVALVKQGMSMMQDLPSMWDNLKADLSQVGEKLSKLYNMLPEDARNRLSLLTQSTNLSIAGLIEKVGSPAVSTIGDIAKKLPGIFIGVIMGVLSAYFFVADRESIYNFFKKHTPLSVQEKWNVGYVSMKKAVGGYFLAQLRIEIWVYFLLLIGLALIKVKYFALIALLIAFLDFLPVFGAGAIMLPWALVRVFNGDYVMAVELVIIWAVGQLVRQLIQPKLVGDSIGVKPIPTLFLLFIGYKVSGVLGMIVAVPIGIIFINLNSAGMFNTTKNSIKLLIKKLNDFRRLTDEDLEEIQADKSTDGLVEDEADREVDWFKDNKYNDIKREVITKIKERKDKKK